MRRCQRDCYMLKKAGEALFGARFQTALAIALGVSDRTVRRWLAGSFQIPDDVWRDLASLCSKAGDSLHKLAVELDTSGHG